MKRVKELNDKELMQEYKDLQISIEKIDCFNPNDILRFERVKTEMKKRNIEIAE